MQCLLFPHPFPLLLVLALVLALVPVLVLSSVLRWRVDVRGTRNAGQMPERRQFARLKRVKRRLRFCCARTSTPARAACALRVAAR